ncbi:hypothetical protein KAU55_00910 [Candidatus Bathyarchaeota archaeon]|nr:hypothetical protein [Candidatus Bathyarchaeota archaeon]
MNATGEYPLGNYTVEVTYESYSDYTTVNMTGELEMLEYLKNTVCRNL